MHHKEFNEKVKNFRKAIIEWYKKHGDMHLPWRSKDDPWALLVAGFLLRKTTAGQVVRVYGEFLRKYPTPKNLLSASKEEIIELIRPLGMEHERARLLKELAECIEKRFDGKIPCEKDKLKELPGVSEYIASEVILGACGKPEPLLDRNMIRILERVFGVKSAKKRPHTDPELWSFANMLVPKDLDEAKLYNFGVLDFARKVCTAKNPHCSKCPIKSICVFYVKIRRS